jgi:hypothetical protein
MKERISQKMKEMVEKTLLRGMDKWLLFDLSTQKEEINKKMDGIEESLCSEAEKPILTGKSTIEQALSSHSNAKMILAEVNLLSCQDCAVRFDETLAEAADFYEFSLDYVLLSLNKLETQQ